MGEGKQIKLGRQKDGRTWVLNLYLPLIAGPATSSSVSVSNDRSGFNKPHDFKI